MALEISKRPSGSLLSDTETPQRSGKEHVKAVTLRSGQDLPKNILKELKTDKAEPEKKNTVSDSAQAGVSIGPEDTVGPITAAPIPKRSDYPTLFPNEPKEDQKVDEQTILEVSQSGDSSKIPCDNRLVEPVKVAPSTKVDKISPTLPTPTPQKTTSPTPVPLYIPYPQRLRNQRDELQFKKFLDVFKQLHINIPLVEAIEQMPNYAKFLKDILRKKKRLNEYETVALTEECSAMLSSKIPPKLKYPGTFTIPCSIGGKEVGKALCDLGASINLMPLFVFNTLGIGEARPNTVSLLLADKSIAWPKGKIEDVLVQVNKFIFPVDFIILDFEADKDIPIILGRSFLATGRTLIDVQKGELTMRVQDQQVTFNVLDFLRYPEEMEECSTLSLIESWCRDQSFGEVLGIKESDSEEYTTKFEELEDIQVSSTVEILGNEDRKTLVPSIECAPDLELKQLPSHLKYAFLGDPGKLPVIISSSLESDQEEQLIAMLKLHTKAIGWTIAHLKGISPTICQHKIILENKDFTSVEPQRRLNPMMKEVMKKEILKWLNAGIIYPIASSTCVSPVQCVPKKGGVIVVTNEKNELIPTRIVLGWRICMEYRKLNQATQKDHFSLPFIDQMLDRLAGKEFYCFLYGYSGYNQIAIAPEEQKKTTFTCPYGTFAFRRMPFGLCNAPVTFQRCMMSIFSDMPRQGLKHKWKEKYRDKLVDNLVLQNQCKGKQKPYSPRVGQDRRKGREKSNYEMARKRQYDFSFWAVDARRNDGSDFCG
ncbi:hypothetical protein L6452_18303 [Arctium lappa]|uniref:Uncharacterized protein n=1 Tax=Arctium lappa TaxID=4217 RepID=A0ACB9C631_ARCLA|nr:hypothetical protein L6452_18303 [Arctium lappa]